MKKHEKALLLMLLAFLIGNAVIHGDAGSPCAGAAEHGMESVMSLKLLQYEILRISTCEVRATLTEGLKQ